MNSKTSPLENILINKLLLSHNPDDRRVDSDQLLHAMENIMLYATASQVPYQNFDVNAEKEVSNIEVVGSEDSLSYTVLKISHEILCNCSSEANLHDRAMSLFDLLANYSWGDKAVLALSAFVKSYGEFWLLMQMYPRNPLAVSIAMLKRLPSDLRPLKRPFKALSVLMKTVVDLTKCVIKFEGLPLLQVKLEAESKAIRELHIYSAVYWIVRSILTCSYQIRDLKDMKPEQIQDSATIATWELSTLVHRLKGMFSQLNQQVEHCSQVSEEKLYKILLNIFKEEHKDNQQVLKLLFASRDDFPLIDCSSHSKLSLSELENKVVILLISKPELLPIEDSLFLVQQQSKSVQEKDYEMVWIPISASNSWTESEKRNFLVMSDSLPWCSVKQPWSLNSAVVAFIKQEWNYKDDPLMVVLDTNGNVTNSNAMDMVFIWGPKAFPFSASREQELWLDQKLTLTYLLDDIDPLLTNWVENKRYVCIYGSNNMEWILDLNSRAKEIKSSGYKLEMVYVGTRKKKKNDDDDNKTSQHLNDNIMAKIEDGDIASPLSFTKMQFFWIRMERMRRSKLRLGLIGDAVDHVWQEISWMIEMDDKGEDWAVMGRGDSLEGIVRVEGKELMECLDKLSLYSFDEPNKALSLVHSDPCCDHSKVITKEEEEQQGRDMEFCHKCGHQMKKFFVYKPIDS